jgi:signal peptidase I
MFGLFKVTGNSLSPDYQEGDFVLLLKIPFFLNRVKEGDIIVFKHPYYGDMIKKIERFSPDKEQIYVIGTHPDSADSRKFGPILRMDLIGKVIWHIRRPRQTQQVS